MIARAVALTPAYSPTRVSIIGRRIDKGVMHRCTWHTATAAAAAALHPA